MSLPVTHNIDVAWDDSAQQTLLCRFSGQWTWHECREALQAAAYLHEAVSHPVTYIYDLTESRLSARQAMEQFRKLMELPMSPQPAALILVENGVYLSLLQDTLDRLFQHTERIPVAFVNSLARARALVRERQG